MLARVEQICDGSGAIDLIDIWLEQVLQSS